MGGKHVRLEPLEHDMLAGYRGEAAALAMRILVGAARILGAEELIDIRSAHIDGCLYHGDSGALFAEKLRRMMSAYIAMGCQPTWTCAPYQAGHRPAVGQDVAWGESNAVAFCNSVLGARTNRYGDFLDICAAVTGRAPRTGEMHWPAPGIFRLPLLEQQAIPEDALLSIDSGGYTSILEGQPC
jgi:predicted aconitase